MPPIQVAVVGSDTGVGKTRVAIWLIAGLRRRGRRAWIHKPIACGDWLYDQAEDGRRLSPWVGDGQPPATVCPFQFPEAASPHLAAAAAGRPVSLADLEAGLAAVQGDHDLIIEGAGGLLTPLSAERSTIADLLAGTGIPLLIVTRPNLGTFNHTTLTVACARQRGLPLLGLVVNRAHPLNDDLATRDAARELTAITGLPVLADLPHSDSTEEPTPGGLAAAVLSRIPAMA
jgi:dethiobiotin synthetase